VARDAGATLTQVEITIIQDAADGISAKQTAKRLFYSLETVRGYWKQIRRKLEARNKAHVVAITMRAGLIE